MPDAVCGSCGADLYCRDGHSGRYRWTDNAVGTDIYGSGCECPGNERGHDPVPDDQVEIRLHMVREQLAAMPRIPSLILTRCRLEAVADGLSRALAREQFVGQRRAERGGRRR